MRDTPNNKSLFADETIDGQIATLNLGPTHPATHGIFQNVLTVDGEKILDSVQTVGYIHRAFEKLAERRPYNQITPITDRLNYCSSPINNMGWEMTMVYLANTLLFIIIGATYPLPTKAMRILFILEEDLQLS